MSVKRIGEYVVRISEDYGDFVGGMVIHRGKKKIFDLPNAPLHNYFGNQFDEALRGKDPYSGRDLTNSGHPSLVITSWSGGAHCCHTLRIYEMGETIKNIATVEAGSSDIKLRDIDDDGIPEVEFRDGAIDEQFASFASSPGGRTVLKYKGGHYELALDLMKAPAPPPSKMKRLANGIKPLIRRASEFELPRTFLEVLMDLSYSGHRGLALAFSGQAWPTNRPGLANFQRDFTAALDRSPYAPRP